MKVQTSNFARGLKVRDRILNKKCKTGQNGTWPRSRATSRSRDLLNKQGSEDVDVDVEDRRPQAYASVPASYICKLYSLILMLISNTNFGFNQSISQSFGTISVKFLSKGQGWPRYQMA